MFHAPEASRATRERNVNPRLASDVSYGNNGAFWVQMPGRKAGDEFHCIISDGAGWEHVSVHCENRFTKEKWTPTWAEMCQVKKIFWDAEDTVMQLHPPESKWISPHLYALHLWRPLNQEIPLPDSKLV